jgi:DNA adenine methylase
VTVEARPFLKWVGGKTQLLEELGRRLPAQWECYHEPFLGGGALFFALYAAHRIRKAFLSDANVDLINCYAQIRDWPLALHVALAGHQARHSEKYYYGVREAYAQMTSGPQRAAAFIYINKAGFNGLWRVNLKGHCNTPWGKHKAFVPDVENLAACSRVLRDPDVHIMSADWSLAFVRDDASGLRPNDFVYCDPPYEPASRTSNFTGYTASKFSGTDQLNLASALGTAACAGVHVLASNSEAARRYYEAETDLKVEAVAARRSVNCRGGKRGNVGEILISNARSA